MKNMAIKALGLINLLDRIAPTTTGFDGATPSNLSNATDGDFSTYTGTGTKNMGDVGTYGTFVWNLGSIKTVLCSARIGMWSNNGSAYCYCYIDGSNDGTNWRQSLPYINATQATSEDIADGPLFRLNAKYIRLRFKVSAAAIANARVYDVAAYLI